MPANIQSPTWPETPSRVYTRSGVSGKVRIPIALQLGERHRRGGHASEASSRVYTWGGVSDGLPHLQRPDARKLAPRVHAGCTFHRRGSSLACQRGERAGARGPCRKPRGGRAHGAGLPAGTPGPRPHLDPRAASRATRTGESVALERSWFHRPARAAPPRVVGCPRPLPEHLSARGWREAPAGPFFDRPAGNELPAWALTSGPRRHGSGG